ncbi:microcephalin isoform X2 [Drosophila innubila]|nr:microcephalin isoform X2 [Drosophila innubila]
MLMTPKARDANKPVSPTEHLRKMMPQQDPNVFRLQRDFNSPSASLRTRAIRALNCPNKAYTNFDVPHAEQSIITEEERNPKPAPTLAEILKDVIIYVEVRTGNDNRSEGVKSVIAKLGAQVNDRLLRNTTHVVFKEGLLSTYKRAQNWNIPIVSILWIEACKVQRRICDPKQFPISSIHKYEHPELFGKIKRVRCLQSDFEPNQRRKRPVTPTTDTTDQENDKNGPTALTPTSTPNNEITRYFKPLSQNKHLVDDEVTDSPGTKLINRITNGFFTPQRVQSKQTDNSTPSAIPKEVDLNGMGDTPREKSRAQQSLSFKDKGKPAERPRSSSIGVEPAHVSRTQVRTTRRSSSVHAVELSNPKVQCEPRMTRRRSLMTMSNKEDEVPQTPPQSVEPAERRTSRRSSLQHTPRPAVQDEFQSPAQSESRIIRRRSLSRISSVEPSTPSLLKKPSFQSIAEEPVADTSMGNKTNYVQQMMEVSPSYAHIISKAKGRRTLYTSDHMDISEVNDENVNPYLGRRSSNYMLADRTSQTSRESFVTTKTSPDSSEGQTPVPIFSSTRLPGSEGSNRRRSIFNVDMDVINERINHINSTSKRRSLALVTELEIAEPRPLAPLQAVAVDAIKEQESTTPKMRRLFTPNEEVIVTPPKSSKKPRLSVSGSTSSNSTLKRRRTLATPKPTAAVGPNVQQDCEIEISNESDSVNDSTSEQPINRKRHSMKRQVVMHTLVHTNMHKEQVQVIHKAIRKLRGMRLDPTVTKNTTHLVSLEPRRTLNLLRGLMRGVWIVNYKWILDSMRAGKWLNEEKYELTSFSRAIEICRTERQAFGISYRCELFRYMETFYVSSLCRPITFNNIKELLLLGGAKLTENRYKAKFIVGDKRRAEDDRIYLTPAWVLDSITAMQVQKFSKYLMKSAIITPYGIRYEDPQEEQERHHRKSLKVCYKDPVLVINK